MPARLFYHLANRRTATLLRNATAAAVGRAAVLHERSSIRSPAARSSAALSFARSRLPYCNSVLVRVCWPSFTLLISLLFAFSSALRWPKLSHSTHRWTAHIISTLLRSTTTKKQRNQRNQQQRKCPTLLLTLLPWRDLHSKSASHYETQSSKTCLKFLFAAWPLRRWSPKPG
jgi:hypothetical protein